MYDDEHQHTLPVASLSRVSDLVDQALGGLGLQKGTIPHFIPGPPVFVDRVAESAVEAAVNPAISGAPNLCCGCGVAKSRSFHFQPR